MLAFAASLHVALQTSGTAAVNAMAVGPAGLHPAREQMVLSLGWHIIVACFGVAFPTMILVMHWRGVRRNDEVALRLAKRWAKVSAVLLAIGAVPGTVLSFEIGPRHQSDPDRSGSEASPS